MPQLTGPALYAHNADIRHMEELYIADEICILGFTSIIIIPINMNMIKKDSQRN